MTAHGTAADDRRGSGVSRFLGVVTDGQTYRNIAYLLLRFPLSITYFVTFVTGLSLGLALTPLVIGIPLLAGVLGLANYLGVVEAKLAGALLGVDVQFRPTAVDEVPLWTYLKTVGTDPRNYLLVGYFLAWFFVGTAVFVLITVLLSLSAALAVTPLTYWLPFVEYQFTPTVLLLPDELTVPTVAEFELGTRIVIDTPLEALAVAPIGLLLGLVSLHLFNALARGSGWLTRRLLDGPDAASDPTAAQNR